MASEYVPDGVPFLRSQDLLPGRVRTDQLKYISLGFHEKLRKSALRPGDVVIVRTGRPGTAAVVPTELPVANCADLVIVRPGPELVPRFLAYYVNSAAAGYVSAHLVGAVQQHFNVGSAKKLSIPIPPVAEQKRIADVLGALDDKIESNRQLAALLEDAAAALFNGRFVDFVGVETFEQCEIGRLPAGWRVGTLAELVNITMGQSPPGSTYAEDADQGPLLVQGMGGFGDRYPSSTIYTSAPTKIAPAGATLMTVRAPVGAVNVARTEVCLGRGIAAVTSTTPAFAEFLIRSLEGRWATEESGTIFPAVNAKQIRALTVVVPPPEEIRAFEDAAAPMVRQIAALDDESRTLAKIRDMLLPKLVSGALRVPDPTSRGDALPVDAGES